MKSFQAGIRLLGDQNKTKAELRMLRKGGKTPRV